MDRIEEFWSRKLHNKSFEWMPPKDCNYAEFYWWKSGAGRRNSHFAIVIDTKKNCITLSIPMSLEDWQKKGGTYMSASMNLEEVRKVADKMTYTDAVYNALGAKGVPFRKATKFKLQELLEIAKQVDKQKQNLMIEKEKKDNGKTFNL